MRCPTCGHTNRPGAKFCTGCSQALPPTPATPPAASPMPRAKPILGNLVLVIGAGLVIYLLGALGVTALGRMTATTTPATPVATPVALVVTPREAGQKGLDWLLDSAVDWQRAEKCYGCHVQSFAIMGAAVAKANEYEINMAHARELADYLASIQAAQGYITTGQETFRPVVQTVLAGIGLSQYDQHVGTEYDATLVKMADWLVTQQTGAGYWKVDHEEAPVDQGEAMTTGAALMTLVAAKRHQAKSAYDQAIGQGAAWLRTVSPSTTQDTVFAVIGLKASGAANDDPDVVSFIEMLNSQQNADGGWGETARLGSNGYATGQGLYAYKIGGVSIHEESFRQGVFWLLDHQQHEGSWQQINSQQQRSNRSSNYATTMWAVIGLGEVFSPEVEKEFIGTLIHPTGSRLSLSAVAVFLMIPTLVMFPVWWGKQGRRWFAFWREQRMGGQKQ